MKTRGELTGLSMDYMSRKAIVTFTVPSDPADIESYKGKDLDIEFKIHKEKRSLNANAYFHVLCGRMAQKIGRSMSYVKNNMISSYGQVLILNDEQMVMKSNIPPETMEEQEILHTKLAKVGAEPKTYFYRIYRGSSTYNTEEMSKLIDGTVMEAKQLGIETMTPDQMKRMLASWEAYEAKHNRKT